jgi:hypothetical protein
MVTVHESDAEPISAHESDSLQAQRLLEGVQWQFLKEVVQVQLGVKLRHEHVRLGGGVVSAQETFGHLQSTHSQVFRDDTSAVLECLSERGDDILDSSSICIEHGQRWRSSVWYGGAP